MNAEVVLSLDKKNYKKLENVLQDLKNVANAREIVQGKFSVEFVS